jgi:1-acyl-sn-glycerol-3-phosphate acyltransferase
MIRRSVCARFKGLYWNPPTFELAPPVVFACTHHGWFDGYVMFHAITRLGVRCVTWMQEFDSFPLFAKVGGMPFPADDPGRRVATIKRTIRLMRDKKRSLILFAEGVLHYPPEVLSPGRALETLCGKVPGVMLVPVAIRYEAAMHERPEAFVGFGQPVAQGPDLLNRTRGAMVLTLEGITHRIREQRDSFELLARGTDDVNERWDMRRIRGRNRGRRPEP